MMTELKNLIKFSIISYSFRYDYIYEISIRLLYLCVYRYPPSIACRWVQAIYPTIRWSWAELPTCTWENRAGGQKRLKIENFAKSKALQKCKISYEVPSTPLSTVSFFCHNTLDSFHLSVACLGTVLKGNSQSLHTSEFFKTPARIIIFSSHTKFPHFFLFFLFRLMHYRLISEQTDWIFKKYEFISKWRANLTSKMLHSHHYFWGFFLFIHMHTYTL